MEQDGEWTLYLSSSIHWFSSGIGNKNRGTIEITEIEIVKATKALGTRLEVSLQASLAFSTVSHWGEMVADTRHSKSESR